MKMDTQEPKPPSEAKVRREDIMQLLRMRDGIEEQIKALGGILESNNVGMDEPLVDREGYPRNDIDVYQVRHARHKIICLQNDHKNLTKEMESKMHAYYEQRKGMADEEPMDQTSAREGLSSEMEGLSPIARVNLVTEGSPAFQAGVKLNDLVYTVGSLNSSNFSTLQDIAKMIRTNVGTVLFVVVKRNDEFHRLSLIPGPWSGQGYLGCNVLPYSEVQNGSKV